MRVLNNILSKTFLLLEKTDECIIELKRLIQNSIKDYDCILIGKKMLQSAKDVAPKCQNDTLELSMEELALLKVIKNNPAITQAELVGITGQSLRTIKRLMAAMQAKGCIARQGGKRFGHWQIL